MVEQDTGKGGEGRAGRSASRDAGMGCNHAHARAQGAGFEISTADPRFDPRGVVRVNGYAFRPVSLPVGDARVEAATWFTGYMTEHPIPGDLIAVGRYMTNAAVAAFEAGRVRRSEELLEPLTGAVRLLTETAVLLSTYRSGESVALAAAIRDYLALDTTPRDRLAGLALSLVQDIDELIGNSEGVAGLHMNGEVAPWESLTEGGEFGAWLGSFDRLRDALDKLFPAGGFTGTGERPGYAAGVVPEPGTDPDEVDPSATARTVEAAVPAGLIPGMDPEVLSALRQSHDAR